MGKPWAHRSCSFNIGRRYLGATPSLSPHYSLTISPTITPTITLTITLTIPLTLYPHLTCHGCRVDGGWGLPDSPVGPEE